MLSVHVSGQIRAFSPGLISWSSGVSEIESRGHGVTMNRATSDYSGRTTEKEGPEVTLLLSVRLGPGKGKSRTDPNPTGSRPVRTQHDSNDSPAESFPSPPSSDPRTSRIYCMSVATPRSTANSHPFLPPSP